MRPLLATLVLGAAALVPVAATGASAQTAAFSFDATAVAAGTVGSASNPSIPLGVAVEQTAPEARSRLTSLGESSSLAAGPYLGDTLTGFVFSQPGSQGVGGVDYPLVITTSAGDEPKDVSTAGVTLHAESGLNVASAAGSVGQGPTTSASRARVERTADGVVATSSSVSDGLVLFDALVLGGVRSSARTSADALTGKRTSESSFTIGRLSARGLSLVVPPTAPVGAGTKIEGPDLGYQDGEFFLVLPVAPGQRVPVDTAAVVSAFKALGFDLTVQEATPTATGVVAPGLTISTVVPAPPDNPQYTGPTPVSYTFGRTATSVTVRPASAVPADVAPVLPVAPPAPEQAAEGPAVDGAVTAVDTLASGSGDAGLPPVDLDAAAPAVAAPAPAPALAPDASPSGVLATAVNQIALARADLSALYLLLVAVAVLAFGSASVLRVLGVKYR